MPSSASQAAGAARAKSRNTARRKLNAATAIAQACAVSADTEDRVAAALAAVLTEPMFTEILHRAGIEDRFTRHSGQWVE